MKKNPPTRACALCGKIAALCDSHFLPAGFYRRMNNPNLITTHAVRTTSRQARDYILCADCEMRFNQGGENFVLKNAANWKNGKFPLLEQLQSVRPIIQKGDMFGYSGVNLNIDTNKLAYFAISYIWRAAIRRWQMPVQPYFSVKLKLGPWEEKFRKYLLGETCFPQEANIWVVACKDIIGQGCCMHPSLALKRPPDVYGFVTLGLFFKIFLEYGRPHEACCVSSPEKLIWVANCERRHVKLYLE